MTTIRRFPGGSGQVFVTTLQPAVQAVANEEDTGVSELPIETAPSAGNQATVIELLWVKTFLDPTGDDINVSANGSGRAFVGIAPGNGQGLESLAGPVDAWESNRFLDKEIHVFAPASSAIAQVRTSYTDRITHLTDQNGRGMIVATNNIASFITTTGFEASTTFTFRAYIGYRFIRISTTDFLQLVTSQQS